MITVVSACSRPPCPATTTADQHLRSHRSQHQRPDQSPTSRRAHYLSKYRQRHDQPPTSRKAHYLSKHNQRQDQSPTSRSARYLQKYKQTRSNMFKPIIPRPTGVKPFLPQPTV
ncbi:hypothetical protein BASA60_003911 [Batrachochytrium salamandrivorans]|nr:hypothetical protein BASA60_003911 [Batrachochytrium salamandrivorans]